MALSPMPVVGNVNLHRCPFHITSDTNGNLIGDGTRTLYYDAENRLTNVFVIKPMRRTEFGYDGFGRRRIERDYALARQATLSRGPTRRGSMFDGLVLIQRSATATVANCLKVIHEGRILAAASMAQEWNWRIVGTDGCERFDLFYHADGAGNVTALMDGNLRNIVGTLRIRPVWKDAQDVGKDGSSERDAVFTGAVACSFRAGPV